MTDCRITQVQKDATDATTRKALAVGESSGMNGLLGQLAAQSHAAIQPVQRRKRRLDTSPVIVPERRQPTAK